MGLGTVALGAGDEMFCAVPGLMTGLTPLPFLVLAGGAGLVGGALVANAFDDHEDRVREEGYDQG